jgi:hypothetical protein
MFFLMKSYRFTLERYYGANSRYRCPNCQKDRVFTRYIDTLTNEHLSQHVGMCSRLIQCTYHYPPSQYFKDNQLFNSDKPVYKKTTFKLPEKKIISYIPETIFLQSLQSWHQNHLIGFLKSIFPESQVNNLIREYMIGTSRHWAGATVFWQIDISGKVRSGKIMLYDPTSGRRVKSPFPHITWAHKALKKNDFQLSQCLFGEHLLRKYPSLPVAIVESEKTALIAAACLPEFLWLATGSLTNLQPAKCQCLSGRQVILFPDLQAYDQWSRYAKLLRSIAARVQISDLLERRAGEEARRKGWDLGDWLIKK